MVKSSIQLLYPFLKYSKNTIGDVRSVVKCIYVAKTKTLASAQLRAPFFSSPEPQANQLSLKEPRCEKTGLRGFRPGPTQTGLYSHRRWLEA